MKDCEEQDDFEKMTDKLLREEKYGEAINFLQKILETDNKNERAMALLEQIKRIMEYQNRDIFGSTNLNMDPWFE